MTPLPEDAPIGDIQAFFRDHGRSAVVHEDDALPSDDEWGRMVQGSAE